MIDTDREVLVGVFPTRASAERAHGELLQLGLRPDQIEFVPRHGVTSPKAPTEIPESLRRRGEAEIGGIVGGIAGCLLGAIFATGVIPGVPILLGGSALGGVWGAVIGIVIGAAAGALIGWGLAADRLSFYGREVQPPQVRLIVHQAPQSADVNAVLRRHGAVQVGSAENAGAPVS